MYEPPPDREIVLQKRQRRECVESQLVLSAAGISSEIHHRDGWWWVVVNRDDLEDSRAELDAYRQENPPGSTRPVAPVPIYEGAAVAVWVYVGIIVAIAIVSAPWSLGWDLLPPGKMQAGKVGTGQWWRTVTALTLHLDVGHLASNLVFGAVFGLLAGRILGGGVAWLAIVVGGALGNYINAVVQPPTHSSIGASTAVFAALGVLVSHSLHHWGDDDRHKRLRRWSPLIGGVVLLGLTGVGGERTDVAAHVTGFAAGMLMGWVGCRLPDRWLASAAVQKLAGLTAIAIVTTAWVVALSFA
jgi:rhomboid protease GluP